MNTDLQDILNSNTGLSSKKAEFLELLKAKQSESNRLRAFYELVVLAQASLETANQIDFTGFIDGVQAEIQNLHEVATKTFEDNKILGYTPSFSTGTYICTSHVKFNLLKTVQCFSHFLSFLLMFFSETLFNKIIKFLFKQ